MDVQIFSTKTELGNAAAALGAQIIKAAIATRGHANVVVATGASQFEVLDTLVNDPTMDWSRVTGFHLDEYIGMTDSHPASFRRYLRERFTTKLPTLAAFHFIDGDAPEIGAELARLSHLIVDHPIDVTFAGIGENGHLAFNDPPADFETSEPYIVVSLDEKCRRQQFGEGWFSTLAEVPQTAISMSVRQIMASKALILSVPDQRKAEATRAALEGPVSNTCPASIVQQHAACRVHLDVESASRLSAAFRDTVAAKSV